MRHTRRRKEDMHPAPARPWLGMLRGCMSAQSRKSACLVSPARRVTREGAERDRQKARDSLSAPVPWARMLADKFSALKYGKQPCGHQSRLNHAVRHLSRTIMMVSPPAVTSLASMTVCKAMVSSRTKPTASRRTRVPPAGEGVVGQAPRSTLSLVSW